MLSIQVYEVERILTRSGPFHKTCLVCFECRRLLDASSFCDGRDGGVYCKGCYAVKFGHRARSKSVGTVDFGALQAQEGEQLINVHACCVYFVTTILPQVTRNAQLAAEKSSTPRSFSLPSALSTNPASNALRAPECWTRLLRAKRPTPRCIANNALKPRRQEPGRRDRTKKECYSWQKRMCKQILSRWALRRFCLEGQHYISLSARIHNRPDLFNLPE